MHYSSDIITSLLPNPPPQPHVGLNPPNPNKGSNPSARQHSFDTNSAIRLATTHGSPLMGGVKTRTHSESNERPHPRHRPELKKHSLSSPNIHQETTFHQKKRRPSIKVSTKPFKQSHDNITLDSVHEKTCTESNYKQQPTEEPMPPAQHKERRRRPHTSSSVTAGLSPLKIASLLNISGSTDSPFGPYNTHINLLEPISPISPIILHHQVDPLPKTVTPTGSQKRPSKLVLSLESANSPSAEHFEKYLVDTLAVIDTSPSINTNSKWFLPSPTLESSHERNKRLSKSSYAAPKIAQRQSSLPIQRSETSPVSPFNSPLPGQLPIFLSHVQNTYDHDLASVGSSRGASTSSTFDHKSTNSSFSSNDTSVTRDDRSSMSPILPSGFDYEKFHQLRIEGSKQKPYKFEYRSDAQFVSQAEMAQDKRPSRCVSPMGYTAEPEILQPDFRQNTVPSQLCTLDEQSHSGLYETVSQLAISPKTKSNSIPHVSDYKPGLNTQHNNESRPSGPNVPSLPARNKLRHAEVHSKAYASNDRFGITPIVASANTDSDASFAGQSQYTGSVARNTMPPQVSRRDSESSTSRNKKLPTIPSGTKNAMPRGRRRTGTHDMHPVSYHEWSAIDSNLNALNSNINQWTQIENDIQELLEIGDSKEHKVKSNSKGRSNSSHDNNGSRGARFREENPNLHHRSHHSDQFSPQYNANFQSQAPKAISMKNMERILPPAGLYQRRHESNQNHKRGKNFENYELLPPPNRVEGPIPGSPRSPGSPTSLYSEVAVMENSNHVDNSYQRHKVDNSYSALINNRPDAAANPHYYEVKTQANHAVQPQPSSTRSRSFPSLLLEADPISPNSNDYLKAVTVLDDGRDRRNNKSSNDLGPAQPSRSLLSEMRPRFMSSAGAAAAGSSVPYDNIPFNSHDQHPLHGHEYPGNPGNPGNAYEDAQKGYQDKHEVAMDRPRKQSTAGAKFDTWKRMLRKPSMNKLRHNN